MRLLLRTLAVLVVGVVVSLLLYEVASAEVGTPFGPNGVNPGFMAVMGVWRALGGAAPSLADASGRSPFMAAGGSPSRRALTENDGVQLGKAASEGSRYLVLLGLGAFVGFVIESVWSALLRPE